MREAHVMPELKLFLARTNGGVAALDTELNDARHIDVSVQAHMSEAHVMPELKLFLAPHTKGAVARMVLITW
jgi:hypothetical protein